MANTGPQKMRARADAFRKDKENDADNDSAVGNEEAEESEIGKTKGQIRGQDGLHRAADSPKIGDLEPARPACPHCDDDYNHCPIAKLKRQDLLPADGAELPDQR